MRVLCREVQGKLQDIHRTGNHPPMVWTHEFIQTDGNPFEAMEFTIQDDHRHCNPGDVVTLDITITTGA